MRIGGYTRHQSLTLEAAAIVKQAVALARRRGHAQLTPLHVASVMLSSSTGLLKGACLHSHSHPLQFKALELCFNVALNRLPTCASSSLLPPDAHLPRLSNALVAAFKRAQTHQRRGSTENQQHVLALKVEIEELIISILDDPSVSRVMREAGFSSTQVKANVEQALSSNKQFRSKEFNSKTSFATTLPSALSSLSPKLNRYPNDDVATVLESMESKKSMNMVIVSENIGTAESLVKEVIDKFEKKEVIPSNMKYVQFISVPLTSLKNIPRNEFEVKIGELRSLVKSCISRGVVLYVGNLDWISSFWCEHGEQQDVSYCPVEYIVMELSRLINEEAENRKLWFMGVASSQTYHKCKTGRLSLEALWSLHFLRVPFSSLALDLGLGLNNSNTTVKEEPEQPDNFNWFLGKNGIKQKLICCSDCFVNFKKEAQAVMHGSIPNTSSSSMPSWLRQYKDDGIQELYGNDQETQKLRDLFKKWNSICASAHRKHHFLEKGFTTSSLSRSSSPSESSNPHKRSRVLNWQEIFEPIRPPKDQHILLHENKSEVSKPSLSSFIPSSKPELRSNPTSSTNSASSGEVNEDIGVPLKFDKRNSDTLKVICRALENKVPWQKDIIPDVVSAIIRSRSVVKKSKRNGVENREESWLFFLGADSDGKETIARELAKTMFGSYDNFISIGFRNLSASRDDSIEDTSCKGTRNEQGASLWDRFLDAARDNPRRVFYLEDVDAVDRCSLEGLAKIIQDGIVRLDNGELVHLKDAIVIFCCERFKCRLGVAAFPFSNVDKNQEEEEENRSEQMECKLLLDLNVAAEDEDKKNKADSCSILDLVDKKLVFRTLVM